MALKPRGIIALLGLVTTLVAAVFALTAGTLLAADPPAQSTLPKAEIQIVPVTVSPTDPNALAGTLSDGKTKVQFGTTGLSNVSIGVPVTLEGSATDPRIKVTKYTWTLTTPTGSKAKLTAANEPTVKFTPDLSGVYKVDLIVASDAGASPMDSVQIRAGEYIGAGVGNCFQCHPGTTQEWSETGHAKKLAKEINSGNDHYGEACLRCHNTGYTPGVKGNGGFTDVQAQIGWNFPSPEEMKAGKDAIWQTIPEALQNVSNIQCEACHGPAKDHVQKGTKMEASLGNGVCGQCHDSSAKKGKGAQLESSKHSEAEAQAWTYPTGPSRQDCVRCHSGAGYVSFIKAPTEKASWDNNMQTVGCSTCHDPHSDTNKWQLRITGKPVAMAEGITKDFGLSATCVECHNSRTTATADAQKGSYPHYSAAAEMLSDTGGVTYGQTIPNSPHGMIVGQAPIANPDQNASVKVLFGGAIPGACVACHMAPNTLGADDPNKVKVGEHSFSMATSDGKVQNTTACQTCHAGITSFDIAAKADYDGNGKVEGVKEEVAGLVKLLQQAIAESGIKPIQGNPYFDKDALAKANEKQKNAIYNYRFVRGLEGRDGADNAIHNFKRSVALLQLSYKDLTGQDVPNAALIK